MEKEKNKAGRPNPIIPSSNFTSTDYVNIKHSIIRTIRDLCDAEGISKKKLGMTKLDQLIAKYPERFTVKSCAPIINTYFLGDMDILRDQVFKRVNEIKLLRSDTSPS